MANPFSSPDSIASYAIRDPIDTEQELQRVRNPLLNYPGVQHHPDGLAASLGSVLARCLTSSDVIHPTMWNRSRFMETFSFYFHHSPF